MQDRDEHTHLFPQLHDPDYILFRPVQGILGH